MANCARARNRRRDRSRIGCARPNQKPLAKGPRGWTEAFNEARPARFRLLLERTPLTYGSSNLTEIGGRAHDPRLGTIARTWLAECAGPKKDRRIFYHWLLLLLIALDDVRVVPPLEALAADKKLLHAVIDKENAAQLAETLATIKSFTPKAADAALIAKADAAIAAAKPSADKDPARLFAEVYANPADDSIRAVLADLLTERGDPRGEFIALQLARHATKGTLKAEERALLKSWRQKWLGGIAPGVMKEGVEYERGFVTRVEVERQDRLATTADAPEWATVETLVLRKSHGGGEFLRKAALGAVRTIYGLSKYDMDLLRDGPALPWEAIGFAISRSDGLAWLSPKPFPHATALVPLLDALEELGVKCGFAPNGVSANS